jgi:hypothetical protein
MLTTISNWFDLFGKLIKGDIPDALKLIIIGGAVVFAGFYVRDIRIRDLTLMNKQVNSIKSDLEVVSTDLDNVEIDLDNLEADYYKTNRRLEGRLTKAYKDMGRLRGEDINNQRKIIKLKKSRMHSQPKQTEWFWNDNPPGWEEREISR